MSGFNKVTSFVLGLIVVLVFLFVFGARLNITDKLVAFRKTTPTPSLAISPTPTPAISVTPTPTKKKGFFESLFGRKTTPTPTRSVDSTGSGQTILPTTIISDPKGGSQTGSTQMGSVTQIPNTGAPTVLLPILIAAFGSGLYLRKKN